MKCLNEPSRSYKGNESSPKGLGYCSFAEEVGKVMEGRDGQLWEVKLNTAGNKYWVKKGPKILIRYEKGTKEDKINNILAELGLVFDSANMIYDDYLSGYDEDRRKEFFSLINNLRKEINLPEYEKF